MSREIPAAVRTRLQAVQASPGYAGGDAWARRLQEAHRAGKPLYAIQIELYRKALGISSDRWEY